MLARGWLWLKTALQASRALRVALYWQGALLVAGVLAMPFDHRRILGLNPWIKPMKFEISVSIFLLTVALLLYGLAFDRVRGQVNAWRRSRLWLGWGFALCMTVENTIIALQSARGVRSHMNFDTVHDAILFAVMGQFIALNTVLVAWLLVLWCVARVRTPPAMTTGVRFGLLMLLAGSAEGVRMVVNGGHTVGAKDGGAGLPFLNWSTGHGDLRIAHFFALHALEILPLLGLLLAQTRWQPRAQVAAVWVMTALYAGGVWWLFAMALRGEPPMAF